MLTTIILAFPFWWPTRRQVKSRILLCMASLILPIRTPKSKYRYHHSGVQIAGIFLTALQEEVLHIQLFIAVQYPTLFLIVYVFTASRSSCISNPPVNDADRIALLSVSKCCHLVAIAHMTKTITRTKNCRRTENFATRLLPCYTHPHTHQCFL